MLADSLGSIHLDALGLVIQGPADSSTASATSTLSASPSLAGLAIGWLVLLLLVAFASGWPALVAAILRRRLPPDPRLETTLEPVAFGHSPQVLRAPRHAVSPHRSLVTSVCVIGLGLVLMSWAAAARALGSGGLIVAFLFVLPTLLVALHARRRAGAATPSSTSSSTPPPAPPPTSQPTSPPTLPPSPTRSGTP